MKRQRDKKTKIYQKSLSFISFMVFKKYIRITLKYIRKFHYLDVVLIFVSDLKVSLSQKHQN